MSKTTSEILVTGATGTQGGAVVRSLLKRGYGVRALCRSPESPAARALAEKGVRVVRGDMEDRASLEAAMKGAHGVFGVQNFWDGAPTHKLGEEGEIRQGKNLLDAAASAGIRHFVQSSGAGVTVAPELPVNRSKLVVEAHARSLGIPWTIIRGVFFMENFANPAWGFHGPLLQGRLEVPFAPDTRLQMLGVEDLGHFVAMAFDRPRDFTGAIFDLAGDELTMMEICATFTRVMGRPVRFAGGPERLEPLRQFDADLGDLFRVVVYERGFQAFLPGLRALHPEMLTLERHLKQTGWAKLA